MRLKSQGLRKLKEEDPSLRTCLGIGIVSEARKEIIRLRVTACKKQEMRWVADFLVIGPYKLLSLEQK